MRTDSDYARVAAAIEYIEHHAREQPTLTEVARHIGLSESHFQRMFLRWAGVSPKSFLQFITLARAKRLLREPQSTLHSSLELGLSGPGRLHDLFVNIEAVTPGQFKSQRVDLRWAVHPTPFGDALFVASERGLCGLSFDPPKSYLREHWPDAQLRQDADATAPYATQLEARIRGQTHKPFSLLLRGTPFQLKVWEALLRIPEGTQTTYGTLARSLGAPTASRAVGTAVGSNLIAYWVPCHRVLRATGELGGYAWGAARKTAMLALEHARTKTNHASKKSARS